jgi:hypothetical protein
MDYEALSQICIGTELPSTPAPRGPLAAVEHAAHLVVATDAACRAALRDEPALAGLALVSDDFEWHRLAPVAPSEPLRADGWVCGLADGRAGCRLDLRVSLRADGVTVGELTLRYRLGAPQSPAARGAAKGCLEWPVRPSPSPFQSPCRPASSASVVHDSTTSRTWTWTSAPAS